MLCTGWVAYDLFVFATAGRPAGALELLPGSLVGIGIGALLGWLCGRSWALWGVLLLASAAGSVLMNEERFSRALIWLPRAVFLMTVAFGVAVHLQRRLRLGWIRIGFSLGLLACVLKSAQRHGWSEMSYVALAVGTLVLALGLWRSGAGRRLATLANLLVWLGWHAPTVMADLRPTRGDMPPPTAKAQGPNLIFIVLDTLRADHLAPYGYERETTPALDAFARDEATLYTDCRSTSPFTLPSHASMFTGLFPSEHHAARPGGSARPLRGDVPTLAQRLRDVGYQTAAIVANDTYVCPTFGLDRGFEHFDDRAGGWVSKYLALAQLRGGDVLRTGHLNHRDATEITDTALGWIDEEKRDGPFFLFLNYLDAHSPYHPPAAFSELFDERRPVDPMNPPEPMRSLLYDREIAFLDSELERLFDGLRRRELFDGASLIVTADHGEDFSEHDIIEHCWSLYDSLVHVPLYVKPAGGRKTAVVESKLSVAELYHLALAEVGLWAESPFRHQGLVGEWHPQESLGPSYQPWIQRTGFDVDANRIAWLEGETKWIVSSSGVVLAFDLERDPNEQAPLELQEDAVRAALERARIWWAERPLPEPGESELNQETLDQLKALGYG